MIHQYQAQGTLVHMDAYPYEAAGNMLADDIDASRIFNGTR